MIFIELEKQLTNNVKILIAKIEYLHLKELFQDCIIVKVI